MTYMTKHFGVEASWTRQGSELEIGTPQGSAELFDVNIDQVQGSFVYKLGGPYAASLIVAEASVCKGLVMNRFQTRGRGGAAGIIKPFSHLTIVVRERAEAEDK